MLCIIYNSIFGETAEIKIVKEIKKKDKSLLWWLIIAVATSLLPFQVQSQEPIQEPASSALPLQALQTFAAVFGKIKSAYVDEVDDADLLRYAIRGMLSGLDPHSVFLDPNEAKRINNTSTGRFGGIGVEVAAQDGVIKVVSPIDGTPAFTGGVKSGDLILMIDDVRVRSLGFGDALEKLRGNPGSTVKLTIFREGVSGYLDIELVRAIIKANSVKGEILQDQFGYVRLSKFHSGTVHSLRLKIKQLNDAINEAGADGLSGLVLDLRDNPGGVLSSAIAVGDMFISAGNIVSTRGRTAASVQSFMAQPDDIIDDAPIVVLVNGGSASASEIVAGALQDHQRAIIMGTKTFGKGSVQEIIPMSGGSALKLTTARYYTPSNRSIQAKGIIPDIIVDQPNQDNITQRQKNRPRETTSETTRETASEADLIGHLENDTSKDDAEHNEKTPTSVRIKQDPQLREALNLLKAMVLTKRRTRVVGG